MIWKQLDYSALHPITFNEVMRNKLILGLLATALLGMFALFSVIIGFNIENAWWVQGNWGGSLVAVVVASAIVALFLPLAIGYSYYSIFMSRFSKFSQTNKDYLSSFNERMPNYREGLIFSYTKGHSRRHVGEFTGNVGADFAIGNVKFAGKRLGYIRLKLPRTMPHMIVDAHKGQRFISNLPLVMKTNQGLSLEGDFNNHYQLYVPTEYEQDALYVFTPDVMQLLVDSGAEYDVEIVNEAMYLYRVKPFDFMDQSEVANLLWLIEAFSNTFYGRMTRYRDDRVAHAERKSVALEGRQLQQRERAATTLDRMNPDKRFNIQLIIAASVVALAIAIVVGIVTFISWLDYTKM